MKVYHTTPTLWKTAKLGKRVYWVGEALTDGTDCFRRSRTWQDISDGGTSVVTESDPARVEPKNVGRANATTPHEQAILEIDALAALKQQQGYAPIGSAALNDYPLPMLAHKFRDYGHKLVWPVYAQPKLDGMRALHRNGEFWSRKGLVQLPAVTAHLQLPGGLILDGELILDRAVLQPGQDIFQETMKAVKRYSALSKYLQYWVFDLMTTGPFSDRIARVRAALTPATNGVCVVPTIEVHTLEEVTAFHAACVELGFEGVILRAMDGPYEVGHRSQSLLKYKDFQDAEFPIVGFTEGIGADAGAIIFECGLPNGATFTVRPKGTLESRRVMFRNGSTYVGKPLTVTYQNLSDTGVPRFPVGKAVRED